MSDDRDSASAPGVLGTTRALACVIFAVVSSSFFLVPGFSEDERRLRQNPIYADLGVFFSRMATPRGLLEKPASNLLLALLSRAGDYHRWPFLLAAIAAHLACVGLLVRLQRALGLPRAWGAVLFLLHPLALHAVVTAFGLTYSLPLALCLWGLSRFLERPAPASAREVAVQASVWLALLSLKQSFIVYPALLFALAAWRGTLPFGRRSIAAGSVVGALALGFVFLYWQRYGERAHYDPLSFGLGQLAALPRLTLLYVLPPHYQFEQELGDAPTAPLMALGASILAVVIAVWIRWRREPWAMALLLSVLLLAPTNSLMPREQLVLKWRLYPSLALFCVAAGGVLEALAARAGAPRASRRALLASTLIGAVLAATLVRDAWLLRSEPRYMAALVRRRPRPSYFALLCVALVRDKSHERARDCVARLDQAAHQSHSGLLARRFFVSAVETGLLREDTALVRSWLSVAPPP